MKTVFIEERSDHTAFYLRTGIQYIFHLFGLHALAENHHLVVAAVQERDVAVRQFVTEVAASIHSGTIGKSHEIALLRGVVDITAAYPFAKDTYLPDSTLWNFFEFLIKNFYFYTFHGFAYRESSILEWLGIVHSEIVGADCGFARAIGIIDFDSEVFQTGYIARAYHIASTDNELN